MTQPANSCKDLTLQACAQWVASIFVRANYLVHVIMRPEGCYVYTDRDVEELEVRTHAVKMCASGKIQCDIYRGIVDYPYAFLHR